MIIQLWAMLNTAIMFPVAIIQLLIGVLIYFLGKKYNDKPWEVHGRDLAIAVDQYMNVVWLGNPDETISSRTGRATVSGKPKWYIKYLLRPFVDWAAQKFGDGPNHCIRSIEYDEFEDGQFEVWKWYRD